MYDMHERYCCLLVQISQWDLARLPVKLGGLGVHDPAHCVYAARLACLTRLTDLASDLYLDANDLYLDASEVSSTQQQAFFSARHS